MGADRLVAAYLEGLELSPVWAGRMPDGRVHVGTSLQDPARLKAEMLAELWCAKPMYAQAIAKTARSGAPALQEIAADLGILAVTGVEAQAIGVAAVAVIRGEVARAKIAGELRALNRAYKSSRLEAEAAGRRFPKYDLWFGSWELAVVRAAAETARSSPAGALAYAARPSLGIAAGDQVDSDGRVLMRA